MASKKNDENMQTGERTRKGAGADATSQHTPLSVEALLSQIHQLQCQLEDERMQRRTLVESNNLLTRMLHAGSGSAAEPETVGIQEGRAARALAGAAPPKSFAASARAATTFVRCGISRQDANRIVIGAIVGVGSNPAGTDLDTELGPDAGLGWDDQTKESAFGFARDLVTTRHSCLLLGQPEDFKDMKIIEDMVKYVENNSVK